MKREGEVEEDEEWKEGAGERRDDSEEGRREEEGR